ncbi:MAG TPA: DUF4157 domain-containing protein, partial [Longimicrobium sp.]|nr:DUF4157 domain-containing protein [Longimicrobium sp.]
MRASETPAAAGPRPRPPAADGPARAPAGAAAGLPLFLGGGRALDAGVRARMEPGLGAPLDGVRVHDDGPPARAARWMGARAFTV